ncbi:MAG TPA: hypothetical protein PKC43_13980 [Phycisphaerales bacterium]|nr:hypothetical protein [Phycisphaerales bacterium]HMP38543.1 hypothetical protein [Phycisphaerales bacterium]
MTPQIPSDRAALPTARSIRRVWRLAALSAGAILIASGLSQATPTDDPPEHPDPPGGPPPVAYSYPVPPPPNIPALWPQFIVLINTYPDLAIDDLSPTITFSQWLLNHGVTDHQTYTLMMFWATWFGVYE